MVDEEFINRHVPFAIIKEGMHWHGGALEQRLAIVDRRVTDDKLLNHQGI
jgi:hypothetical protein